MADTDTSLAGDDQPAEKKGSIRGQLWFWVLIAIVLGIAFGLLFEKQAIEAKWLADAFIQLIKTITGPVIFVTVVVGVAALGNLARAGGLAIRALGYFLVATIVALALGLAAGNLVEPGSAFKGKVSAAAKADAKESISEAKGDQGVVAFITDDLLPASFVEPFVENQILRILILALLTAAAISGLAKEQRERIVGAFELASQVVFRLIRISMWAAPLGAFGGMAFTVAKFGGTSLESLGLLMLTFWGRARSSCSSCSGPSAGSWAGSRSCA